MLGQAIASLEPAPRRWLYRIWGQPDVHTRQKWSALWPTLSRLPLQGVRLLDAGCGDGRWALELAARRPGWAVVGVDHHYGCIRRAIDDAIRLGLTNASFIHADFLGYRPATPFDVVLSVASAHYLVEAGRGHELFRTFCRWLGSEGVLLLLGPRTAAEVPRMRLLPPPFKLRDGLLTAAGLHELCHEAGLRVDEVRGHVGRLGTLAKQVNRAAGRVRVAAMATYPVQMLLSAADGLGSARDGSRRESSILVLRAARPAAGIAGGPRDRMLRAAARTAL